MMNFKNIVLLSALTLGLSGCKTLDSVQEDLGGLTSGIMGESATPEQIKAAFEKTQMAFESAEHKIKSVESEDLAEYDVKRAKKITELWQELQQNYAKVMLDNSKVVDRVSLFSSTSYGESIANNSVELIKLVDQAQAVKDKVLALLKPVRDGFSVLDNLKAKLNFKTQYGQLKKKELHLKELLTEGEEAQVQAYMPTMLANMQTLEKKAVVKHYLGDVLAQIKVLANSEKAKVLPNVYDTIRVLSTESVSFANLNFRDYEKINLKVEGVKHQLARIDSLFAQEQALQLVTKEQTFESYLLNMESQLFEMSKKAGLGDMRHLSFAEQLNQIQTKL